MLLIVYWLIAGIISVFQNMIGIGVGKLVGLEAPYALLSSAISMVGGHMVQRLLMAVHSRIWDIQQHLW